MALAENQRRTLRAGSKRQNLRQKQLMIAAIMPGERAALETCRHPAEQRSTCMASVEINSGPLVAKRTGKAVRDFRLTLSQNVYRVAFRLLPFAQAVGAAINAEKDERWIKRQ